MKKSTVSKLNQLGFTPIALLVYGIWWGYVFYFLYWKTYDDNAAGADASIGVGLITLLFVVSYIIGFIIAAIKDEINRVDYLVLLGVTVVPLFVLFVIEH